MPWVQGIFQVGYLVVIGGQNALQLIEAKRTSDLGLATWGVPFFWFAAPLELVVEGASAPAFGRLALAVAALGLLLGGAMRLLMLSADVLTRTSRPASLWWILTAPIDRTRFSLAPGSIDSH